MEDSFDSLLGPDYKSPLKPAKQYGRSGEGFLSRMKSRNARELRTVIDDTEVRKPPKKRTTKVKKLEPTVFRAADLIEDLECSQDMKRFITTEYQRERRLYNFLPDPQVARAVIHRFRTHIANYGSRVK